MAMASTLSSSPATVYVRSSARHMTSPASWSHLYNGANYLCPTVIVDQRNTGLCVPFRLNSVACGRKVNLILLGIDKPT